MERSTSFYSTLSGKDNPSPALVDFEVTISEKLIEKMVFPPEIIEPVDRILKNGLILGTKISLHACQGQKHKNEEKR